MNQEHVLGWCKNLAGSMRRGQPTQLTANLVRQISRAAMEQAEVAVRSSACADEDMSRCEEYCANVVRDMIDAEEVRFVGVASPTNRAETSMATPSGAALAWNELTIEENRLLDSDLQWILKKVDPWIGDEKEIRDRPRIQQIQGALHVMTHRCSIGDRLEREREDSLKSVRSSQDMAYRREEERDEALKATKGWQALSERYDEERDAAKRERDNAIAARDSAVVALACAQNEQVLSPLRSERDAAVAKSKEAVASRDTAYAQRDRAIHHRDDAMADAKGWRVSSRVNAEERDKAEAERDEALVDRRQAIEHRQATPPPSRAETNAAAVDAAEAERDDALAERDQAVEHLDASLAREAFWSGEDHEWGKDPRADAYRALADMKPRSRTPEQKQRLRELAGWMAWRASEDVQYDRATRFRDGIIKILRFRSDAASQLAQWHRVLEDLVDGDHQP